IRARWTRKVPAAKTKPGLGRVARRFVVIAVVLALIVGEIGLTASSSTAWFLTFPLPRNALAKDESTAITSVGAIDCQPSLPDAYASCLFTHKPGQSMTFYLWVPAQASPSDRYPLVLLLHGGGERADPKQSAAANEQTILSDPYVEVWGPGYPSLDAVAVQQQWPSFIVVPQVVIPNRWVNVPASTGSYKLSAKPSTSLQMAHEIVEALLQMFSGIDRNRLYVTGLSMGGYGTWEMIERWPGLFAAAAPLSGAGDPALAGRIKNLPIWAFHNTGDPIVPVSGSRDMIAAIKAAGGHPLYTELPGDEHDSWLTAYGIGSGPNNVAAEFYNWLFSQRKGAPAASG
ncbi:MAG TPA: alpha/beta hydrolase-fold protein, partial [Thermomicrobiaceae bacterium]|nr:alpha/beta hydrolase-fold protein [Thermomicrobiaceae bacterium]